MTTPPTPPRRVLTAHPPRARRQRQSGALRLTAPPAPGTGGATSGDGTPADGAGLTPTPAEDLRLRLFEMISQRLSAMEARMEAQLSAIEADMEARLATALATRLEDAERIHVARLALMEATIGEQAARIQLLTEAQRPASPGGQGAPPDTPRKSYAEAAGRKSSDIPRSSPPPPTSPSPTESARPATEGGRGDSLVFRAPPGAVTPAVARAARTMVNRTIRKARPSAAGVFATHVNARGSIVMQLPKAEADWAFDHLDAELLRAVRAAAPDAYRLESSRPWVKVKVNLPDSDMRVHSLNQIENKLLARNPWLRLARPTAWGPRGGIFFWATADMAARFGNEGCHPFHD